MKEIMEDWNENGFEFYDCIRDNKFLWFKVVGQDHQVSRKRKLYYDYGQYYIIWEGIKVYLPY